MKLLTKINLMLIFTASLTIAQTKWNFDKAHTNIGFKVDHMVITTVSGNFQEYEGSITLESDTFENASINFTIEVASINTENKQRDNHLRSDDFFNAEKFPEMTFRSKSMKKVDGNKYKLVGDLTIRDVTKEVTLDVVHKGTIKDPWGNTRAGFNINGAVNRFDFNLKWNTLLEAGGLVVGEDITIDIDTEVIKQQQ